MSIIYKFLKSTLGLIFTTVSLVFLSVIWVYPFIEDVSSILESQTGVYVVTIGALAWMLCVPLLIIKKLFKEDIEDFGWKLPGNKKEAVVVTAISIILLIPFLIYFSSQPSFQSYYQAGETTILNFILVNILFSSIYYASEEFLFRGFLFFGLYENIGKHSFWVTSLVFSLLHFSKPGLEVPFSFLAGLLLCYLSYRTRSFIPAFVVHFLISIFLNDLIIFG